MGDVLAKCIISILQFVHFLISPIVTLFLWKKPPNIPPVKNSLLKLSATNLASKIRNGELSSETIVKAYIERIKEVNPFINAVTDNRFEEALKEARICDAKLKAGDISVSTLEKEKLLYGVPFTVKESCSVKGLSYTSGALPRRGIKATVNGHTVELLRKAGAIPLCVTNTSEMCSSFHSSNFLYGTTKNPYDLRRTAGGSSGGEGALLGAGGSILGIGSDIIGSIRVPSNFNCIFGHKPTPGIIPLTGHFPMSDNELFQKLLVIGPMGRYAEDLHLAVKILSSTCDKDLRLDEPVDIKQLNVYYIDNFNSSCTGTNTTRDIRKAIEKAKLYLEEKGASVKHLSKKFIKDQLALILSVIGDIEAPDVLLHNEHLENKKNPMLEFIKSLFGLSTYTLGCTLLALLVKYKGFISSSERSKNKKVTVKLRQKFNDLLGDDGVIICPTFSEPAPLSKLILLQLDSCVYASLANLLYLPATQVPAGLNKEGIPIGYQVIAASHQDRLCLAVAKELQKGFGGWVPPSS